jgi:hypothetical protein
MQISQCGREPGYLGGHMHLNYTCNSIPFRFMTTKCADQARSLRSFVVVDNSANLRGPVKDVMPRYLVPCELRDFESGDNSLDSCPSFPPDMRINDLHPCVGTKGLSGRRKDFVRLVARDFPSEGITDRPGLGTRTFGKHRSRILRKLGPSDVPSPVPWCLPNGFG